jgi:hypothetical protein
VTSVDSRDSDRASVTIVVEGEGPARLPTELTGLGQTLRVCPHRPQHGRRYLILKEISDRIGLMRGIVEELIRAGWKAEGKRAVYGRDGSRLVVEARDVLWLVIDEAEDRRVLGIEPTVAPEAVAKAIVAWEQFEPGWR